MTAGTELLRRKADKTGHVITVPLITDATGKKFGKSEGNAVWLNPEKTSPYEMYQFWMNVMDADTVRFLKIFTFLSLDEIEDIRKQFEAAPHERLAQKSWLVKLLHLFTEKKPTKKHLTSLSNSLQETSKPFCQRAQTRTSWCAKLPSTGRRKQQYRGTARLIWYS